MLGTNRPLLPNTQALIRKAVWVGGEGEVLGPRLQQGGWYIGLEAREEATCHFQVPLRPSVRAYSLPSEVNLSSGGDTV